MQFSSLINSKWSCTSKESHFGSNIQSCLLYMVEDGMTTVELSQGTFLLTLSCMNTALRKFVSNWFYRGALTAVTLCGRSDLIFVDQILENPGGSRSGIPFIPFHRNMDVNKDDKSQFGKFYRPEKVDTFSQAFMHLLGEEWSVHIFVQPRWKSYFLTVSPTTYKNVHCGKIIQAVYEWRPLIDYEGRRHP